MEIQRENDFDKVSFSFRLKTSLKKYDILKEYLDLNFRYLSNVKKKNVIIIIDLEAIDNFNSIVCMIEKYRLKSRDFDLYFDIISSYDFGGISMPHNIVKIIRQLDCDIHFSYVVC